MSRPAAEWEARGTEQRGHVGTAPHSPQVTMRLAPRRLRNRMACSPRTRVSSRAC